MFYYQYNWQDFVYGEEKTKSNCCDHCDLYHTDKFNGFKCACDCHNVGKKFNKSYLKNNSGDLDWETDEETTKPGC